MLRAIRGSDFREEVQESGGTTVVLFWATWCGFCRSFKPAFDEIAERSDVNMVTADISDESDPLWDEYDIDVVPTLVMLQDGRVAARQDGIPGLGLSRGSLDLILAEA